MKVVTTAEMRQIERNAMDRGLSIDLLIARAGSAVAAAAAEMAGDGNVLVLTGPGNNGADGIYAALELERRGLSVAVYTFRRAEVDGGSTTVMRAEEDLELTGLRKYLAESTVIVDALLGIGASRPPEGLLAQILEAVGEAPRHASTHIAVDVPTGANADTGAAWTHAFRADITICMGFAKRGVTLYPGAELAGRVEVADMGFPDDLGRNVRVSRTTESEIAQRLPTRSADANKGTNGRLFVLGGSREFVGAPAMTGIAAYRIGAGLVEIATPAASQPMVAAHVLEAVFAPLPEKDGRVSVAAMPAITRSLSRARAAVIGPGMGLSDETVQVVRGTLAALDAANIKSSLVDADGLNALARIPEWWRVNAELVLTPHPGEMSRLTGKSIPEIQADRVEIALRFASTWGKVVVLKGAGTVVASPSGDATINPTGGPNLATAGTGDVLSGTIGGLLAQGCSPWEAAVAGVYLHGLAGDLLRARYGDAGTLASDLLDLLPIARARVLEHVRSES